MGAIGRKRRLREDAVTRVLGFMSIIVSIMIAGMWFAPDHGDAAGIFIPAVAFFWMGQRMMRNRIRFGLFG